MAWESPEPATPNPLSPRPPRCRCVPQSRAGTHGPGLLGPLSFSDVILGSFRALAPEGASAPTVGPALPWEAASGRRTAWPCPGEYTFPLPSHLPPRAHRSLGMGQQGAGARQTPTGGRPRLAAHGIRPRGPTSRGADKGSLWGSEEEGGLGSNLDPGARAPA